VFEKRSLKEIRETKREGVIRYRKLHNEELHNLYSSPHVIRLNKSKRMKGAEHVARMEDIRNE
jgi:hypothetical protein